MLYISLFIFKFWLIFTQMFCLRYFTSPHPSISIPAFFFVSSLSFWALDFITFFAKLFHFVQSDDGYDVIESALTEVCKKSVQKVQKPKKKQKCNRKRAKTARQVCGGGWCCIFCWYVATCTVQFSGKIQGERRGKRCIQSSVAGSFLSHRKRFSS